ncbi:MAG TPA: [protein-PII] uridylyltransferase, partial [Alphaproteobacteria bacterium]|nr:[protein-PII] uridylyltransferase [Alphaproteobacteria bacterium]
IDGEALTVAVLNIGRDELLDDTARRAALVAELKGALASGRKTAREYLEVGPSLSAAHLGIKAARALSELMDAVITALYIYTTEITFPRNNPTASERLAVVATGGYGRGTLAPGSDVDLLFLLPYKQTAWGESVVEAMLYVLWDLGLKVGHGTRSVSECITEARRDMTTRTALLEARFLIGEERLYRELRQRYWQDVARMTTTEFIDAKLKEREERHLRTGNSRYSVEPNIKDGKGGQRDLQTLFWIGKYVYRVETERDLVTAGLLTSEECDLFEAADSFLWEVRCMLHFVAGRAEETLSFDRQLDLAEAFGFRGETGMKGVEHFMKRYFSTAKDVGDLTRIIIAVLEHEHKKSFPMLGLLSFDTWRGTIGGAFRIQDGRLDIVDDDVFSHDPVNLLRLFQISDAENRLLHPHAVKVAAKNAYLIDDAVRNDREANSLFIDILTSRHDPERVFRDMNETGVLGAFIPDFGKVVAMMQFNMYHHYTVDEHLIRAIGNLARIDRGELEEDHPLSNQLIKKIQNRRALYVAVMLHDIAKGREEDHSIAGERIARELGPRLGLTPAEVETVAWLVREHLTFSTIAQSRDPADPKTIAAFTQIVQSPERLKLLLILTVADIRAVGPGVWNGWKGELLRTLYFGAEAELSGGFSIAQTGRIEERKRELAEKLADWPADAVAAWLKRHAPAYWLGLDIKAQEVHARLTRQADLAGRKTAMAFESDGFRSVTAVTIYTPDAPGLFAKLAGAISSVGASIQDAKAFTTNDQMALDVFYIQDAQGLPLNEALDVERLKQRLEAAIAGTFDPAASVRPVQLARRQRAFDVEPDVIIDNQASDLTTLIEVNARDRAGLLYDLARTLAAEKLSITSAHIATFGEKVVDVFYVLDNEGRKVTEPARLDRVRQHLTRATQA